MTIRKKMENNQARFYRQLRNGTGKRCTSSPYFIGSCLTVKCDRNVGKTFFFLKWSFFSSLSTLRAVGLRGSAMHFSLLGRKRNGQNFGKIPRAISTFLEDFFSASEIFIQNYKIGKVPLVRCRADGNYRANSFSISSVDESVTFFGKIVGNPDDT